MGHTINTCPVRAAILLSSVTIKLLLTLATICRPNQFCVVMLIHTVMTVFMVVYKLVVTRPMKMDQICTKYTKLQNVKYFDFCVECLLSDSYKMLLS